MLTYLTFVAFSTWKFMFTPMAGPAAGLTFFETLICCLIGAYISAGIFYFGSNYFMKRALNRSIRIEQKRIAQGKTPKIKKRFTKTNRIVIRVKHSVGKYGACFLFPLFLSIPLGTIITAKFYKHDSNTFVLILLGLTISCLLITGGTYLITFAL